jgi:hypothetical protein
VQDEQRQRRWDADRGQLGLAVRPELDRAVALQRADQLGDEQRVAAGSRHLAQKAGPGVAPTSRSASWATADASSGPSTSSVSPFLRRP